jgi:uncharacterized protein
LSDVNVLIYAFRKDLPQHALCRAWLGGVVVSDARFGLSPLVFVAVVRVRVYRTASTIEEAFGFCRESGRLSLASGICPQGHCAAAGLLG